MIPQMNYPGLQAGGHGKALTESALANHSKKGPSLTRLVFRAEARGNRCSLLTPA